MKNETFDFNRFWTYFKYDLRQMWRNHSKPAIFIGGMGLILYVVWVLVGLVFNSGQWTGPGVAPRLMVFFVAFFVLELYQSRTYGYLTDRKKGSAWLMVPASATEKFVSMLLITLIVIPVLFLVVFLSIDSILALADPTVGDSLIATALGGTQAFADMAGESASMVDLPYGTMVVLMVVGLIESFLFFLLCGICFKKYKVLSGIGILFLISTLMSIVTAALMPGFSEDLVYLEESEATRLVTSVINWSLVINVLIAIGVAAGVFFRIKTLKH